MAGSSSIEWTDATWNPTRGCTCVSPGCKHCYAMKVAGRFSGPGLAYEGLAFIHPKAGGQWTGKVRLVDEQLDAPLRWRRPRRIFVNSMSDLFHEALTIEQIAEVFAVMYLAPQHTFQVLTKRAERMREVLTDPGFYNLVLRAAEPLRSAFPKVNVGISDPTKHPALWVQLGVSVESDEYLFARGRALKETPAAVRFLSCEPLLDELRSLREVLMESGLPADCACGHGHGFSRCPNYGSVGQRCPHTREGCPCPGFRRRAGEGIHWVIVGGESGRGARPFDLVWARRIVKVCGATGTPVFVKQLGAAPFEALAGFNGFPPLRSSKGGDIAEWPEDLRVRQFPEVRHG